MGPRECELAGYGRTGSRHRLAHPFSCRACFVRMLRVLTVRDDAEALQMSPCEIEVLFFEFGGPP